MSRVGLAIYTRAGVLVASVGFLGADGEPRWWPGSSGLFLDELDDTGSFSFNVQADATDLSDIAAGQIVVVSLDASPVWRGVIRQLTTREIAEDEAGRYTTIAGVGEVGRLDEMRVYPPGVLGQFPFPDDRPFNWTAPEFDDSGWDAVVVTAANYGESNENYGLPEGFPSGSAEWIWDEDSSGSVPAGIKYMRKATTVSSQDVLEAWSAADDRNEVWLNCKSVLKSSDAPYDGRTTAVELLVSAGDLQVAAKVENRNALKAGLLFSLLKPQDDSASPVVESDNTWLVKPDADTLGMNAGQITNILLDEYVARGGTAPARTWTDLLDSDGNAWDVYEEVTVPVNTSYFDVLRQMVEMEMCEFRMSPDAFELNLYRASSGAGSTVAYTLDETNLRSLTWEIAPAVSTALLVRFGRGWTDYEDASSVSTYGLVEAPLSLGGIESESVAQAQAGKVVSRFGRKRAEISAAIEPASAADEPFTKYHVGDSITVTGPDGASAQKVIAVALGVDEVGNPTFEIHLADHIEELLKRQQVMLKRLAGGSVGGRSQTTTIPYEPRSLSPREPQELDWSWAGSITTTVGTRKGLSRAVRIREFRMELEGTISGTYTAELLKNGTTVTGSEVSLTAAGQKYVTLGEVLQQRPAGYIQPEITAVGSGATRITLTVVYA